MFLLLGRIELKLFRCGIGPDRKFWLACVLSLRCVLDVRNDGIFSRYIPCLRVGVLFFTASFIHDLYPPSCRITGIAVKSSQCGSSLMISVFSCTTCYIFQRQGLVTMDIWYSTPPTAAEIKSGWQQSPVPLPLRLPSLSPYFLSVTFRGGRWRASDRGIFIFYLSPEYFALSVVAWGTSIWGMTRRLPNIDITLAVSFSYLWWTQIRGLTLKVSSGSSGKPHVYFWKPCEKVFY